jgi:hypothetical protein
VWRTKEVASAGPGTDNTACHTWQQCLHHRDGPETLLQLSTYQVTATHCTGLQGMANTLLLSSSYWNEQQSYIKLSLPTKSCTRSRGRPVIIFFNVYSPCIVNIFQYISNKMQLYTVCLYLETVLHVSGGTSTHRQERIQLYLQHLVFVRPLLLPAATAAGNSLTNTRY